MSDSPVLVRPRPDDFSLGRPVLVGTRNPHSSDPIDALAVDPPGASGDRLWRMSGLSLDDYCCNFAKVNVDDRVTFSRCISSLSSSSRVVVFGLEAWRRRSMLDAPWPETVVDPRYGTWWLLPHPGGLNRIYNAPEMCEQLRSLMTRLNEEYVR